MLLVQSCIRRSNSLFQKSNVLQKHLTTMGANPFFKYERIPSQGHRGAIQCPSWPKNNFTQMITPKGQLTRNGYEGKGMVMRGSGLWGPEQTYLMRQNLWNRLHMKRPQRVLPSLEECQLWYEMEAAILWFCIGLIVIIQPLAFWAQRYGASHECMPWYPARMDGTRGEGPFTWYFE